jgi:DNA-binding CsgD family transcriptional regulator
VHAVGVLRPDLAREVAAFGFPDNDARLAHYVQLLHTIVEPDTQNIVVLDDVQELQPGPVLDFLTKLSKMDMRNVHGVFVGHAPLISEAVPNPVITLGEQDLLFTFEEMTAYFAQIHVQPDPSLARAIYDATGGWAFGIGLAGVLLTTHGITPTMVRNALTTNVNEVMDRDLLGKLDPDLLHLLVELTLIDHHDHDLVCRIARDPVLVDRLEHNVSFVHYSRATGTYALHGIVHERLVNRQGTLSEEDRREVYRIAADWCLESGYKVDGIDYLLAAQEYERALNAVYDYGLIVPQGLGQHLLAAMSNMPRETLYGNGRFAMLYPWILLNNGNVQASEEVAGEEIAYLAGQPPSFDRSSTLSCLYNILGYDGYVSSLHTGVYDFAKYFKQACDYLDFEGRSTRRAGVCANIAPYVNRVSAGTGGTTEAFISELEGAEAALAQSMDGCMGGVTELARAERALYRFEVQECRDHGQLALDQALGAGQFEIAFRALYLLTRADMAAGRYSALLQDQASMLEHVDEPTFTNGQGVYEVVAGWFYAVMGSVGNVASWLMDDFVDAGRSNLVEGFSNGTRARCYLAQDAWPACQALLDSCTNPFGPAGFLFGQVYIEVLRAVCDYHLGRTERALEHLRAGYTLAEDEQILLPFVEMGNDMRALASLMLRQPDPVVPEDWLHATRAKATTWAKRVAQVRNDYHDAHGVQSARQLTNWESRVLNDISQGLSREEIAILNGISPNSVKATTQNIYNKFGVTSRPEAIRYATAHHILA